ncbi:MAG TPA: hypothetical protein VND20_05745, partial [Candidatus Binataceae bacterium]|nr:hypothetical protein [Candidatus Binataceae bacterium]
GLSAVFDVTYGCRLNDVEYGGNSSVRDSTVQYKALTPIFGRNDTYDILCGGMGKFYLVTKADMDVIVLFTPRLIRHQIASCAHFYTIPDSAGHPRWMQSPEADPSKCKFLTP